MDVGGSWFAFLLDIRGLDVFTCRSQLSCIDGLLYMPIAQGSGASNGQSHQRALVHQTLVLITAPIALCARHHIADPLH